MKIFDLKQTRYISSIIVMMIAIFSAGCGPKPPTFSHTQEKTGKASVEGSWTNENGIAISNFRDDGTFSTEATDTKKKIASGDYRIPSPHRIEIRGLSLIRQTPISFNCLLVSPNRLNCTNTTGQRFILKRQKLSGSDLNS